MIIALKVYLVGDLGGIVSADADTVTGADTGSGVCHNDGISGRDITSGDVPDSSSF